MARGKKQDNKKKREVASKDVKVLKTVFFESGSFKFTVHCVDNDVISSTNSCAELFN